MSEIWSAKTFTSSLSQSSNLIINMTSVYQPASQIQTSSQQYTHNHIQHYLFPLHNLTLNPTKLHLLHSKDYTATQPPPPPYTCYIHTFPLLSPPPHHPILLPPPRSLLPSSFSQKGVRIGYRQIVERAENHAYWKLIVSVLWKEG